MNRIDFEGRVVFSTEFGVFADTDPGIYTDDSGYLFIDTGEHQRFGEMSQVLNLKGERVRVLDKQALLSELQSHCSQPDRDSFGNIVPFPGDRRVFGEGTS